MSDKALPFMPNKKSSHILCCNTTASAQKANLFLGSQPCQIRYYLSCLTKAAVLPFICTGGMIGGMIGVCSEYIPPNIVLLFWRSSFSIVKLASIRVCSRVAAASFTIDLSLFLISYWFFKVALQRYHMYCFRVAFPVILACIDSHVTCCRTVGA